MSRVSIEDLIDRLVPAEFQANAKEIADHIDKTENVMIGKVTLPIILVIVVDIILVWTVFGGSQYNFPVLVAVCALTYFLVSRPRKNSYLKKRKDDFDRKLTDPGFAAAFEFIKNDWLLTKSILD